MVGEGVELVDDVGTREMDRVMSRQPLALEDGDCQLVVVWTMRKGGDGGGAGERRGLQGTDQSLCLRSIL